MALSTLVRRALSWRPIPLEIRILVPLLVIIGGIWAFIELAEAVGEGATQRFDEAILERVRDPQDPARLRGPAWFVEVARDITALGGYAVLTMVTIYCAGLLIILGKWIAFYFLLASVIGGHLVGLTLKAIFERPRPDVVAHLSYVTSSSFPSGHSMMSAVVYLSIGVVFSSFMRGNSLRLYVLIVALVVSCAVGVSRILMGVHYPTDVLGGWTAGLVWSTLCFLVARRWQLHHSPEEAAAASIKAD